MELRIEDARDILEAEVITGEDLLQKCVSMVCASDLMSDVLTFSKPDSILLTSLINPQAVRTAEMTEIAAIIFVHGKTPQPETVSLAQANALPLMTTAFSMFEACGKLYKSGLVGCDERE